MKKGYILHRAKGEPIYISPYSNVTAAKSWESEEEVTWYGSTVLSTHEKDETLFRMYRDIDRGVDRWIQDARYIPRLLVSALTFLVVYFIFSLAVRDPIPMVDELIIATGAAIGVGVFLSRRDKKSDIAMKRRLELKQNASRADFALLDGLAAYETYLDDMAFMETIELADRLVMAGNGDLPEVAVPEEQRGSWQDEFANDLLEHVRLTNKRLFSWYVTVKEFRQQSKQDVALSARLLKQSMAPQGLDLALLALLITIPKH